jgi:hypothetical protein
MPLHRRRHRLAVAAAALLAAPALLAAQALPGASIFNAPNLVTNGGFEATPVTGDTHWALSGDPSRPDWGMTVPSGFGWRVTGSVDIHNVTRSGWIPTPNGVQTIELNGNPIADARVASGIWQDIAVTTGSRYTLQFILQSWNSSAAQIWWNGSALTGSPAASPTGPNQVGTTAEGFSVWEYRDLLATAPVATIGFTSLVQNSAHGPIVDDVRLYAQPMMAPEPSSMALLAVGLAGLAVARRRRRTG